MNTLSLEMAPPASRPSTVRVAAMVSAALPFLGGNTFRALELVRNVATPPVMYLSLGEHVTQEQVEDIALETIDHRIRVRPGWTCSDRLGCAHAIALAWEQAGTWLR